MAGIYTRSEVDKIIRNSELTDEQKTEQLFALHGRALDDGYVSKRAAENAKPTVCNGKGNVKRAAVKHIYTSLRVKTPCLRLRKV